MADKTDILAELHTLETAVEGLQTPAAAPEVAEPIQTPEPAPAAPETAPAPKTLGDLVEAPPAETDEYRTAKWGEHPLYICKGLRYGVAPCPFSTLSLDEMIEHVSSKNNLHTSLNVDNFGNPVLFKD